MGASIRRSPTFCCPGQAPVRPLGAGMRPRQMARLQTFDAEASSAPPLFARGAPVALALAPAPTPPGSQPMGSRFAMALPPAGFASCAWLVGRWLHGLAACPAGELAQFHVLRALVPLVCEAHAALATMQGLTDVQSWVSRIETELACPLHQGPMQQPDALACGHVFEAAWLRCLPAEDDGTVHCPTCRTQGPRVASPAALLRVLATLRTFYRQTGQALEDIDAPPEVLAAEDDAALAQLLLRNDFQTIMGTVQTEAASGGRLPLFQAALDGDTSQVQMLLSPLGRDEINAQDAEGSTALHVAADNNHLEVARLLLQAGASVDVQDGTDFTPLHMAAARGYVPMIVLLLAHGADVNASEPSPLFEAVSMGQTAAVRVLLAANATGVMPETLDATLLHEAVASGEPEVVRMLIAAGCDARAASNGLTPLELAVSEGLDAVADVLTEACAHADPPLRGDR